MRGFAVEAGIENAATATGFEFLRVRRVAVVVQRGVLGVYSGGEAVFGSVGVVRVVGVGVAAASAEDEPE